jgi:hypothetical protein
MHIVFFPILIELGEKVAKSRRSTEEHFLPNVIAIGADNYVDI